MARHAGCRRSRQSARPVRALGGVPRFGVPRDELGSGTVPARALPDGVHPSGGRGLAGAERGSAVFRPCLVHPAAPAASEPSRVPRPLRRGRRRSLRRRLESRGGSFAPPAGRARPGVALDRRPEGRARAPSAAGDVLRRTARGGRRAGPAPLVPRRERPGRNDHGRGDERPRGDGRRPLDGREARLLGRELPRSSRSWSIRPRRETPVEAASSTP